jgi:hypothetical protein
LFRIKTHEQFFDSNAAIEKWLLCPVSQFPRSSEHDEEHEHEGEPLAADFGVSFSVERYAALGAG